MAIEFFTKEGKGFEPKVSIRRQGQIGFNQGSVKRFSIEHGQNVLLGYDRDKKMVALRITDESEKGAKKIIVKGTNGSISAKTFLDYFGIPHAKTKAYPLEKDEENNYLFFCLEPEKTSPGSKQIMA